MAECFYHIFFAVEVCFGVGRDFFERGSSVLIRSTLGRACVLLSILTSSLVVSAQTSAPAAQPLDLPVVAPVVDCSALIATDLSKSVAASVKILGADVVGTGAAAYCKIQLELDSVAKAEVHLPVSGWMQRFLVGGQVAGPTGNSFATMSRQDLGNRGREDAFANNAQLRVDFAYRMVHLEVLASKALIARYYGQPSKFNYYNACSEPGREGMMEVQRFPEDFDGTVTGCPPINDTINNGLFEAWNVQTNTRPDGSLIIASDKLPLIHKAVLGECDALDGVKDGIVSDPLHCHPKLTAIECKAGQDPATCISSEQLHVALELYRGAHDGKGGKLEAFGVLPGSEPQWTAVIAPPPPPPGRQMMSTDRQGTLYAMRSEFAYPALGTNWQLSQLKFDRADFDRHTSLHYLYDATDPDLSAYNKAGHKLILWQGLADNNVLPAHTILYYTALQKTMGVKTVDQFVRFYVLPGVGHCGGGDGPSIRDFLTPIQLWVERGIAPGVLPGEHTPQQPRAQGARAQGGGQGAPGQPGMAPGGPGGPEGPGGMPPGGPGGMPGMGGMDMGGMGPGGPPQSGPPAKPDLTRPIYPYPYLAKYIGTGDIKDAANYVQGPAAPAPPEIFNWFGAGFYTPHYEKWCTGSGAVLTCKDARDIK